MQQELRYITCSKHLMHGGKASNALIGGEMRCKDAAIDAFSTEKLAGTTGSGGSPDVGRGGGGGVGVGSGGGTFAKVFPARELVISISHVKAMKKELL